MKFYTLGVKFESDDQLAYIMLNRDQAKKAGLVKISELNWEINQAIEMNLAPLYENRVPNTEMQFRDILPSGYDSLRNTVNLTSFYIKIVSPKLKDFLIKYAISEYKYCECVVTHDITKEKRTYYMLVLKPTHYDKLYYPASSFKLTHSHPYMLLKTYNQGEIKNKEEFYELRKQEFMDNDNMLSPLKCVYLDNYDILSGGTNSIIINEKVKQALEKEFPHIECTEFTDYEIITGYKEEA